MEKFGDDVLDELVLEKISSDVLEKFSDEVFGDDVLEKISDNDLDSDRIKESVPMVRKSSMCQNDRYCVGQLSSPATFDQLVFYCGAASAINPLGPIAPTGAPVK